MIRPRQLIVSISPQGLYAITRQVEAIVAESGVQTGRVKVYVKDYLLISNQKDIVKN